MYNHAMGVVVVHPLRKYIGQGCIAERIFGKFLVISDDDDGDDDGVPASCTSSEGRHVPDDEESSSEGGVSSFYESENLPENLRRVSFRLRGGDRVIYVREDHLRKTGKIVQPCKRRKGQAAKWRVLWDGSSIEKEESEMHLLGEDNWMYVETDIFQNNLAVDLLQNKLTYSQWLEKSKDL